MLPDDALVLDVGGWAAPFARADWVVDLLPYATRGLYGEVDPAAERFTSTTWVAHDVCVAPWPFDDHQFDFAVCAHTLEDVRDPVTVCRELARVARAGYIETPSRLEEQSWGVHGPWVGWSHHRWLVDVVDGGLRFVAKPGVLHAWDHFPAGHWERLDEGDRVVELWWEGELHASERIFVEADDLHGYLREVATPGTPLVPPPSAGSSPGLLRRVAGRLGSRR